MGECRVKSMWDDIFSMRTLSKKTQYTLRALYGLTRRYGQGPTLIASRRRSESIPHDFLENILLNLSMRDWSSKKGKGGGYSLASIRSGSPWAR
jgi:DNA-binding IscR family transcriptional regulator